MKAIKYLVMGALTFFSDGTGRLKGRRRCRKENHQ